MPKFCNAQRPAPFAFHMPFGPSAYHVWEMLGNDREGVWEILDPANLAKMATLPSAVSAAKKAIAGNSAARRVYVICIAAQSDERGLISVGPRGGWKKDWNFGTGK